MRHNIPIDWILCNVYKRMHFNQLWLKLSKCCHVNSFKSTTMHQLKLTDILHQALSCICQFESVFMPSQIYLNFMFNFQLRFYHSKLHVANESCLHQFLSLSLSAPLSIHHFYTSRSILKVCNVVCIYLYDMSSNLTPGKLHQARFTNYKSVSIYKNQWQNNTMKENLSA